jgi:type VI secretion system protein ImpC
MQIPAIPYTILILAPFTGESEEVWSDSPLEFDAEEPDHLLPTLHPSVFVSLPASLCPAGGLELRFSGRKDFTPDGLIVSQPFLSNLLEADRYLADAVKKNLPADEIKQGLARWPDLPPVNFYRTAKPKTKTGSPQSEALSSLLSMVSLPDTGGQKTDRDAEGYTAIAEQILAHIFNDPSFMKMEAAWQGLKLLAGECSADNDLKLMIVPVGQDTFEDTLDSILPHLVRNPPALLLVDLPFGGSLRSVNGLAKLADFGQLLLVPSLAWITAEFFQVGGWDDVDRLSFLPHHLEQQSFAKWKKVRQSQATRWLCLTCNRFLNRYPYGPDNRPRHIEFTETGRPWLAPVWAAAKLICQRVNRSKWPTGTSAWQTNKLEGLGLDMTDPAHPLPIEKLFTETRLEQLERCGIVALISKKGSDSVILASNTMVSLDISLDYQSLISLVTRFTLWCKDNFAPDIKGEELAAALQAAWRRFLDHQQTRYEEMLINVEVAGSAEQTTVRLEWLPSRQILPSGRELVLEFAW